MPTSQPRRTENPVRGVGLLGCLAAILLSACAGMQRVAPAPAPDQPLYAAVIDAGSSGSRIYVYRWRPAGPRAIPWVELAWEKKVEPGLSFFASEPSRVASGLAPLIEFAIERIGGDRRRLARYPLHLKATGGVRLLSGDLQRALLDAATEYLETTPFQAAPAEVISGREEGIFGWISVNYILGYLDDGGPFPSAGALDLGGASTQITFVPLDLPREGTVELVIGNSVYPLYSYSYLGLGQDEARLAVARPACYPSGYQIPEGGIGAGDYHACKEVVRSAIARPCQAGPCSLMGIYQPPVYGEFFAFSAFTFAASFFDLGERFDLDRLEEAGIEFCAMDWETIRELRADELGNPYLGRNCFTAAFLVTLLSEGYGFPLDGRGILVPSRLQGQEVGWTLGALLFELTGASLGER